MKLSEEHIKIIQQIIPKQEQQKFIDAAIESALQKRQAEQCNSVQIYADGGSRGNPGPSGGGFAIYKKGQLVAKGSEYFGIKTNNQAEYLSLRSALREAYTQFSDCKIECLMDSELVVKQLWGEYKVKSENVRPLFEEVRRIASQFKDFSIKHIPRHQNQLADRLANEGMDGGNTNLQ